MAAEDFPVLNKLFEVLGKLIYLDADLTRQLAFSILSSEFGIGGGVEYWTGFVSGSERKISLKDISEIAQIVDKSPAIEVALNMIFQMLIRQKEMFVNVCSNMSKDISGLVPESLRDDIKNSIRSTISTGLLYPHYVSKYESQDFFKRLYTLFGYERIFVFAGLLDVIGPPVRGAVKVRIDEDEYVLGKLRTVPLFIRLSLGRNIPLKILSNKFYMYVLIPRDGYENLRIFGDDFEVIVVGTIRRHVSYNPVEGDNEQQPEIDKYLKVVSIFDSREVSAYAVKEFLDMMDSLGYSIGADIDSLLL